MSEMNKVMIDSVAIIWKKNWVPTLPVLGYCYAGHSLRNSLICSCSNINVFLSHFCLV